MLDLSSNQLEGPVPSEITRLAKLGSGCAFSYNKLYSTEAEVTAFLDGIDPDWDRTQTVPPTGVQAAGASPTSAQLSWVPIPYIAHGGHYQAGYATTPGGPYTVHGTTDSKLSSAYLVDGLAPDTKYYLVMMTYTPAHGDQQNDLWSHYSEEESAWTLAPHRQWLPLVRTEAQFGVTRSPHLPHHRREGPRPH